jgi:hypothetical protein
VTEDDWLAAALDAGRSARRRSPDLAARGVLPGVSHWTATSCGHTLERLARKAQLEVRHVTEDEWLAASDPHSMLGFLHDRTSERKQRLFACACVRRLGIVAGQDRLHLLRVNEEFADGLADRNKLEAALAPVRRLPKPIPFDADMALSVFGPTDMQWELSVVEMLLALGPDLNARVVVRRATDLVAAQKVAEELRHQADLIRDIFGNPFRTSRVDPIWLTWNGGTTANTARVIYDNRAFKRLHDLAGFLEDAGCIDNELLGHLREPGPHVRGCWALDVLLRKV